MKHDESVERFLDDSAESPATSCYSISKDITELPSHAPNETNRKVTVTVSDDIAKEECVESVTDHLMQAGPNNKILSNKGHKGGQKLAGTRLLIDTTQNLSITQATGLKEVITQWLWKPTFKNAVEELPSEIGPTALIAKDKAQGRCIGSQLLSIVKTGVGPSSKDAGYAGVVSAERTRRSHHVALHMDLTIRTQNGTKRITKHACHALTNRPHATCAIEPDGINGILLKVRQKARLQYFLHSRWSRMDRIDALRANATEGSVLVNHCPVRLRAATVCYQYHI